MKNKIYKQLIGACNVCKKKPKSKIEKEYVKENGVCFTCEKSLYQFS
jgi:hypothetical protein